MSAKPELKLDAIESAARSHGLFVVTIDIDGTVGEYVSVSPDSAELVLKHVKLQVKRLEKWLTGRRRLNCVVG